MGGLGLRHVAVLLALAAPAAAGPGKDYVDETNPRARGAPLDIVFKPWYCRLCEMEGRLERQESRPEITMLRLPVAQLAARLEIPPGDAIVIQSPHFKILSTLRREKVSLKDSTFVEADLVRLKEIFPKLKIGRDVRLDRHQRAHLYHIRAERIYSHFQALVESEKPYLGMELPYELYLFDDYAPHHRFCDELLGKVNDKQGVQSHGRGAPNFMLYTIAESSLTQLQGKGDRSLSNNVIHGIAHCLIDGHGNYYFETKAWLEEGIAHYYERRETPEVNTFCQSEGAPPAEFLRPDWEKAVFAIVRRGQDTPLGQWCEKQVPGELTGIEQGLCWSIVKWMVETEPIRFAKMLRKLDEWEHRPDGSLLTATTEEALQHAFGASPTTIHQRWRAYVLEQGKKK